jgi:hypothetical protein
MNMKNNPPSLLLGLLSYTIGTAVGLFLILVAAWADLESTTYGFPRLASAGLGGLQCPILMTRGETATISFGMSNTTDNRISPSVRTHISTRVLPEEFNENFELTPGESRRLEWQVDTENIDMGRFIFAKVLLFSSHPIPSREASCGIFILDLPGTGGILLPILVMLSLIGTGWGLYQLNKSRTSSEWLRRHFGSMTFLAALMVLGFLFIFIGGWVFSLLVLVLAVLTVLVLLSSLLISKPR